MQKLKGELSSRFPVVIVEQSTKSFAAMIWLFDRTDGGKRFQQSIPDTLVISLGVMMRNIKGFRGYDRCYFAQ